MYEESTDACPDAGSDAMPSMTQVRRIAAALLLLAVLPDEIRAQDYPLFASDEPLAVTIDMPLKVIVEKARVRPEVEGVLRYLDTDGSTVSIDMTMTTRGRSRLAYCHFPPLKINLKRKQAAGSIFAGQNTLKIVTHCRRGATHLRYLQQEFGIYKAYNELTDFSFRARWVTVTYKDSTGRQDNVTHDAFFIESIQEIAARSGRELVMQNEVSPANLDPVESSKYALFQYLIANTDWSMIKGPVGDGCCHNGRILAEPGSTEGQVVLPYDFDQAGLINTRYSIPSGSFGIRSVRQRIYRGRCQHNGNLDATIAGFNEQRAALENHLAPEILDKKAKTKALKYIDAFFEVVNDPAKRQLKLLEACVGV